MARPVNSSLMKSKKSLKPAASVLSLLSQKKQSDWLGMLYGPATPDAPSQQGAANFLISALTLEGGAGLLSDPGTGKTIVSMAVLRHFMPKRVLIVAPLTSLEVTWAKRLRSLYDDIVTSVHDYTGNGVLLIGYEHFRVKKNIKKILKFGFDFALFDESQGLKTRSSLQSRAVRRLRMTVPMRVILSGTPIDESPIDMWAQMRFIAPHVLGDVWAAPRDPRKYEGPYFGEEFCHKAGFMNKQWVFTDKKLPEFLDRISPYLYRLPNEMEQPEFHEVYTELLGRQRRIYDQMAEHGLVKLNDKKAKAGLKPVRDLRCFQITGGSLKMDDESVEMIGRAKQRRLAWLIKRLEKPVVFCRFLSELEDVVDVLGEQFATVRILDGSIKDKKNNKARTRLIEDFQAGQVDALAVQARTGGVSIEFTASYELVFYSMGYSYIDFQQIIARFRRYGQEKRVRVYFIIARDTIDEEPLRRIVSKRETVNPIMDHLRESSMAEAKKVAKKVAKKAAKAAKKEAVTKAIGVDYLADKHDVSGSAVRAKLRDHNVPKAGKSYGWDTKAEADKAWAKTQKAA